MSLSAAALQHAEDDGEDAEAEEPETVSKKRPSQEQLHAARRRLKMRMASTPSPLTARPKPPKLHPLSGAGVQQLRWLAAAYKMCPEPTQEQVDAISERVQIPAPSIAAWFQSRKMLQDWLAQQPNMSRAELQNMFYAMSPSPQPPLQIPNGA